MNWLSYFVCGVGILDCLMGSGDWNCSGDWHWLSDLIGDVVEWCRWLSEHIMDLCLDISLIIDWCCSCLIHMLMLMLRVGVSVSLVHVMLSVLPLLELEVTLVHRLKIMNMLVLELELLLEVSLMASLQLSLLLLLIMELSVELINECRGGACGLGVTATGSS